MGSLVKAKFIHPVTRRKFIFSGLASLLLTIILSGTGQLQAQEPAVVYLEPQSLALGIGETSSIVLRIEDAANVYGVQIDLAFDANQIKVLDADENRPGVQILAGDFLALNGGFEAANEVNNEAGQLIYAYSRLAPAEPASGSGALFEFEVEALESGSIDLLLGPVIVASPEGDELPVRVADPTEDNGVVFLPKSTATTSAEATAVPATDTPASLTPTTEVAQQPPPTAESSPVDTATAISPAVENKLSPTQTQATGVTPETSGGLSTSTLLAPPANNEPQPEATNNSTAEPANPDPTAAQIAAVPPASEQEDAPPPAEQTTPALTVIGQNVTIDENQTQPAPPATSPNNEGKIVGVYLPIGLIAISVALIVIWFLRRIRLR